MRFLRSSWAEDELRDRVTDDDRDFDTLEPLLEFLEEFASLRRQKILDDELVWDSTIGWHAARYYFYNFDNNNVGWLRSNWMDGTLYQNLEILAFRMLVTRINSARRSGRRGPNARL